MGRRGWEPGGYDVMSAGSVSVRGGRREETGAQPDYKLFRRWKISQQAPLAQHCAVNSPVTRNKIFIETMILNKYSY